MDPHKIYSDDHFIFDEGYCCLISRTKLIRSVKKNSYIYDWEDAGKKDRTKLRVAWGCVLEDLKVFIGRQHVQDIWDNLVNRYKMLTKNTSTFPHDGMRQTYLEELRFMDKFPPFFSKR